MKKIELILKHPVFVDTIRKIDEYEQDRKFCKHGLSHVLDVARIAALMNNGQLEIETIYAAALLHDIGRVYQYEQNIPHEQGSAGLARVILKECGFEKEIIDEIVTAILCHNREMDSGLSYLGKLLYKADKVSRNCFMCDARDECKWSEEKKNKMIIF